MKIKIIKQEKNELEIELDNLTVAEVLRNELWEDSSVEVSAWKRENPSKDPILVIKTKGKDAKKVLLDAIGRVQDQNSEVLKEFKKVFK
jgi:DNA-directed RNA polymerase subunit L